jgi:hypothetical protein
MGRHNTHHPRRWATAGLIIIAAPLTACAGNDDDDAAESASAATVRAGAPAADGGDIVATDEAAPAEQSTGGQTGIDFGQVGRDVIVEMHVVMSSDDIARSVTAITSDAAALGGGIASSDVDYGVSEESTEPAGHALLVVRVPPDRVDRLLDGLDATGTVLSINQTAQDVTEQLVDLDVRIANARASVANVREFMDQTTDLGQLVTLEGELTRRQTELEQLEAQQRNLSERVELATVTVEVVAAPNATSVAEAADEDGIGDGLRSGWDAFVAVVLGVVYVLAVLLPFLVVTLVVASIAWLLMRRRPAPTASEPQPTADAINEEPDRERATPVG